MTNNVNTLCLALLYVIVIMVMMHNNANSQTIIDLDNTHGDLRILGSSEMLYYSYGLSVADVNNDNSYDLIAAKGSRHPYNEAVIIVFGNTSFPPEHTIDLETTQPDINIENDFDALFGEEVEIGDLSSSTNMDLFVSLVYASYGEPQRLGCGKVEIRLASDYDIPVVSIVGIEGSDFLGRAMTVGDYDNDGIVDVMAGATFGNLPSGPSGCGQAYVFYGHTITNHGPIFDLASEMADITISGIRFQDLLGDALSTGDINGDNIDDMIVSAPWYETASELDMQNGAVFIIYGSESFPDQHLVDLSGEAADLTIIGPDYSWTGLSLATGDVNGDGIDDIVCGASSLDTINKSEVGGVFVIYGSMSFPTNHVIDLRTTSADIEIVGRNDNDQLGRSVATGDVNLDGYDDIIANAGRADPLGREDAGEYYILFGSHYLPSPYIVDLAEREANITIFGDDEYDCNGECDVGSGDVNGDGIDDIVLGVKAAEPPGGDRNGEVVVIYGYQTIANPPLILQTEANPDVIPADGESPSLVTVSVTDPDGLWDIYSVRIDASALGGDVAQNLFDDGTHADETPGDGIYSGYIYAIGFTPTGEYDLPIEVKDTSTPPVYGTVHLEVTLPPPPVSDFSAVPRSFFQSVPVQFTDLSAGIFDQWHWDFGDGDESLEQHPSHEYDHIGSYTLILSVTGPGGTDTEIKDSYIHMDALALVTGPGPGPSNPPAVAVYSVHDISNRFAEFTVYPIDRFGVNVATGDLDGAGLWEIVTGPGPGTMFGPQVRAFLVNGNEFAGGAVNFLAYSTKKYGVNVAMGDVDGNDSMEIITGPGPGKVFGPHVRGFTYDGENVIPLSTVSFLAYGTNKYGVNVSCGDVDGDGYDEIITGPGPGSVFGPHVRGFNHDGSETTVAMSGISFMAYGTNRYGVNVACGDVNGDGRDEIITGPGPGAIFGPHVRGWRYDGQNTASLPGLSFLAYGTNKYGVVVSCGDVDNDGIDELLTAPGPGPSFGCRIRGWEYTGTTVEAIPSIDFLAYNPSSIRYGGNVSFGQFRMP